MKEIRLTKGYFALVDDEDFEFLNQWEWQASCLGDYVRAFRTLWIGDKAVRVNMVRQIVGVSNSDLIVDHIDGNPLNNQKDNLRITDRSGNSRNSAKRKTKSSSIYKGVSWNKKHKKWEASINLHNQRMWRARFDNEKDAAIAYNEAAIKYHGEFARLNKIA